MLRSLWTSLRPWFLGRERKAIAARRSRRRPLAFDSLEDRVNPATFTVTNPGDFAGPHTGITLRDALTLAAINPGPDDIDFDPGISSSTITLQGLGPLLSFTELVVSQDVTIDGTIPFAGGRIRITTAAGTRLFSVTGAATNFALRDLILDDGTATFLSGPGGAVNVVNGTVSMTNVDIVNSQASLANGAGLNVAGGSVTLNTVRFDGNVATGNGGAISVVGGTLTMTDVNFSNNIAGFGSGGVGGAIFVNGGAHTQNGGTFNNNSATEGGAIYVNAGSFGLSNATIRANTATVRGGGAVVNGGSTFTATDVLFGGLSGSDGNSSPEGAAITSAGSLTLNRVTIANNAGNAAGGGIRIDNGTANIYNTTITANAGAAGLYVNDGGVNLVNDTIASNPGFGVFNSVGTVESANTIFANNGTNYSGGFNSSGTNLFSGALPAGSSVTDLANSNPLLGSLGANGATTPTLTMAIAPGSPAFNAGNNTRASNVGLTVDARGANRFASVITDIGAYEILDTLVPTATFTPPANIGGVTAGNATTTVVVTYADPAGTGLQVTSGVDSTTFGLDDITVSNGATVVGFSPSGLTVTYTIQSPGGTWAASPQGTYTVSVNPGGVRDRALNAVAAASTTFQVDTVPPAAILSTAPPNITAATGGSAVNPFTVTYTDALSGVNLATISNGDLVATNGVTTANVRLIGFVGSPASVGVMYEIDAPGGTWNASPQGTYTLSLQPGAVSDLAGNPIAGVVNFGSFIVSTIRPFATLTTPAPNITAANAIPGTNAFTITYTTLGAGLNSATYGDTDVTVRLGANPPLSVISVSNSSNAVTYTVQAPGGMWSTLPQGLYTISLNGNEVFDVTGNAVLANPTIGFFNVDVYRPTATMTTSPALINANYVGPNSNTFTITYDDIGSGVDPATFGIDDIVVTAPGGTPLTVSTAMVSGLAVTYTVQAPGGDWSTAPTGTYTIALPANNVRDVAGNGIAANANFDFFIVDRSRPTALLSTPPVNVTAANALPPGKTLSISYFDTGTGIDPATFGVGNITITNGATTIPVLTASASGNVVTYTFAPASGWGSVPAGTYTVALNASVEDFADNTVNPVASFATFNVDVSQPTVTVSPTGTLTNASPIIFTIQFSEPVTGLTAAGINVTNGTAGTLTPISTSQYTLAVTPTADGIVTVTVPAGAAQDALGNPNLASNIASVTSDRTGPTTAFSAPSASSTTAGPVTYTVTWTDPNFSAATLTAGQVILNSTGTAGGTVSSVVVTGNTALVTISDIFGNGTLSISTPAGVAVDSLGNLSAAAGPSATFTVSGNRILNISQPAAPRFILPGTTYVYAIDYSNTGNQISPNARINVNVPTGGTYVAASSTPGWANTGGSAYQFSLGNLAIGASGRLLFAVRFGAKTPPGTVATFTASITDNLAGGAAVATSTVSSLIVNPNRLRWGRCC